MDFASPWAATGYYRGSPQSMRGEGEQGTTTGVGSMASGNVFTAGQGPGTSQGSWSPTILYLFALIIAEMFIFGILARKL